MKLYAFVASRTVDKTREAPIIEIGEQVLQSFESPFGSMA